MDRFGVIGGGIGGLCVARVLARAGHDVTVFEPDAPATGMTPDEAFQEWVRPHIAQLRQPHSARSVIRKLMLDRDETLYRAVLEGGMVEWPFQLPDVESKPHDPDLVGFLGRRPTFEKAIRGVVENTPGVRFIRDRVLRMEKDPADPRRIARVHTKKNGDFAFDAVVECSGRRSKILDWLDELGVPLVPETTQECGIIYFSRYFRFREGARIEESKYPSGPSANLSTLQYTMNRTDAGTFSLMLGVAPWEPLFTHLRDEEVFMSVVRSLPGTMAWLDPAKSEPIWRIESFGGLINKYRKFTRAGAPPFDNLFIMGDARFHTNPIFGWGMALAMRQAFMLADACAESGDMAARVRRFEAAADVFAQEHYKASAGEDVARMKYWKGELADPQEPGTYEYFVTQVQPAAFQDQTIFQAVTRRLHLLDAPNAILRNDEVNARAARIPRTDHKKMSRTEVLRLVEETARLHLPEHRMQLAAQA